MTFDEYRALSGINFSTLKAMADSPLAYQHVLANPPKQTDAMALGSAIHTAVLEPDRFPLEYAVWEGGRRGTNDYKAFVAQQGGRQILTVAEYDQCLAVRDAVRAHKPARRLLRYGQAEVTLRWIDPLTHLRCKARLDWLRGGALTDLKSTTDIDARIFGRLAGRMLYHCQLAFYRMGLRATGHPEGATQIIAVESDPPHDVAVYFLDDYQLEASEEKVQQLLARVKQCRRNRSWPGRYAGEQLLELPPWQFPSENDISDLGIDFEVRQGVTT